MNKPLAFALVCSANLILATTFAGASENRQATPPSADAAPGSAAAMDGCPGSKVASGVGMATGMVPGGGIVAGREAAPAAPAPAAKKSKPRTGIKTAELAYDAMFDERRRSPTLGTGSACPAASDKAEGSPR